MRDARRRRKNITVVWLNLRDAFGSVPHSTLMEMLRRAGLAGGTLDVVADIYRESFCSVRVNRDTTEPILCKRRVKQGGPLSPILFDFVLLMEFSKDWH